jgi:myo-inositol-1-phosphate synthase
VGQALDIAPATGKLGILTPGMGAVASTAFAGIVATRMGLAAPIGSLTQMAHIRLGERSEGRNPLIREFVPLASLDDIVFGGWDPISPNALEAARTVGCAQQRRPRSDLSAELEGVVAMDAVFDQRWVKRLDGVRVKTGATKWDLVEQLVADIERFRSENGCDRLVMIWCGSTEAYQEPTDVHQTVAAFEQGLRDDDEHLALADVRVRGDQLRRAVRQRRPQPRHRHPVHGRARRGQQRAAHRQGLQDRPDPHEDRSSRPASRPACSACEGWYSTNILGNRDGEVLDDPENFKTKECRSSACSTRSCSPRCTPTSTATSTTWCASTTTRRGATTRRAGTTSTSSDGWGYPMQIKVDFLCRDSILAAPIVLDLALFLDLAQRAGQSRACRSG